MFLSVMEVLCDKVLISLFFKFKMYFYCILQYLKFLKFFQELSKILLEEKATEKDRLLYLLDHLSYYWYVLLFFYSEFDCGKNLTVHKIYISKLLLWNNRTVTIYLVSNDN